MEMRKGGGAALLLLLVQLCLCQARVDVIQAVENPHMQVCPVLVTAQCPGLLLQHAFHERSCD
jgi:multisubunit Na+/H+ antiporter MnhE subunit